MKAFELVKFLVVKPTDPKKMDRYNGLMAEAKILECMPTLLDDLFTETLSRVAMHVTQVWDNRKKAEAETRAKWDKPNSCGRPGSPMKENPFDFLYYARYVKADQNGHVTGLTENVSYFSLDRLTGIDVDDWYKDMKRLLQIRADDFTAEFRTLDEATSSEISKMTFKLVQICRKIYNTLGGFPDEAVSDVGWGVGGHFNGILAYKGQKVSFKSFLAGGWNIQKEHIRFRVTPLKGNR